MPHEILAEYYQVLGRPLPSNTDSAIAGIPSLLEIGTRLVNEMTQRRTPNLIIDVRGNGGGMTGVLYPFLYQIYGDDYFTQQMPNNSVTVMSSGCARAADGFPGDVRGLQALRFR